MAESKVIEIDLGFDEELEDILKTEGNGVKVGIFGEEYAQRGLDLEIGSGNYPPRPFFTEGVDSSIDEVNRMIDKQNKSEKKDEPASKTIKKMFEKIGLMVSESIKDKISFGDWEDNSLKTKAWKGVLSPTDKVGLEYEDYKPTDEDLQKAKSVTTKPLIDTGGLLGSVGSKLFDDK